MKLLRFKLNTPFRSLPDGFEVSFLPEDGRQSPWECNPYCLAGRNGSGKSNILEALAAIFYHIECIYLNYRPPAFEGEAGSRGFFKSEVSHPDAYELDYLYELSIDERPIHDLPSNVDDYLGTVLIRKETGKRPVIYKKLPGGLEEVLRRDIKKFLPEYIIGYSSGENEILSLPFFKMRFVHFDEYRDRLLDERGYTKPEARFIFADASYSQAIFLANYLMQEQHILAPFYQVLGIKGLEQFRIIIRTDQSVNTVVNSQNDEDRAFSEEHGDFVASEYDMDEKTLTDLITDSIISKLKKCATTWDEDDKTGKLYLDYLVTDATKQAFQHHFQNEPIELFQAFQILLTLNLFEVSYQLRSELYQSESLFVSETVPVTARNQRIMQIDDIKISKEGVGELFTKSLSDGEHQYLHTIGLCLLFRNTNSLFLLDEPETHLNPDWRSSFISVLRSSVEGNSATRYRDGPSYQDFLITSHSPFIISDCKREYVLVFSKEQVLDESGYTRLQTRAARPDFKTFGASVNQITIKIYGQKDTIGDFAKSKIDGFRRRLQQGEDPEKLIGEVNDLLGDSVEKIMFINEALDVQEGNQ